MALVSASRSFGLSPPIEANNAVSVGPGHTGSTQLQIKLDLYS
jgi:hypothetical protein